jgi:lysine 2,3-aminomutase
MVITLHSKCASECVYCLRGHYDEFTLSQESIINAAKYCKEQEATGLKEVLLTGGDPLFIYKSLEDSIKSLAEIADNIKIVRIGTRMPVYCPNKFDARIYDLLEKYSKRFIFEIALQVNHYVELTSQAVDVIKKLQEVGCRIYSQNVLIKDVNDDIDTLVKLYNDLRYYGVEAHYLFHTVPVKGTSNFRTTVQKGIDLIRELTSSGRISGRAKPQYALLTDVGKVVLYEDTIVGRDGQHLILDTKFKFCDRLKWNANYVLPNSALIKSDGTIEVKYLDEI